MYINETSCCALGEMTDICDDESPEDTLSQFCSKYWNSYSKQLSDPGSFILFTGVSRVLKCKYGCSRGTNTETCRQNEDRDWGQCECDCHCPRGYGEKLAALIRRNNLGKLKSSPKLPNRNNHPNHIVTAWLWAPNLEALTKWYTNHRAIS